MIGDQLKVAVAQAFAAFNQHDLDGYFALDEPTTLYYGFGTDREPLDYKTVRSFYTALFEAFPDVRATILEQIHEADRVSVLYEFRGTHVGDFLGVTGTGKKADVTGQVLLRFRDGRIIERWANADRYGILVQLGAISASA